MFLGVRNCTQTAYTPAANLPTVGLCYGYGLMLRNLTVRIPIRSHYPR